MFLLNPGVSWNPVPSLSSHVFTLDKISRIRILCRKPKLRDKERVRKAGTRLGHGWDISTGSSHVRDSVALVSSDTLALGLSFLEQTENKD